MTIPTSSIDFGDRGRTTYRGIEELAESIEQNGLIQPIVLSPKVIVNDEVAQYSLVAGGRRLTALLSLGITELHHGVSSSPGRYGYVLKDEATSPLSNLLAEIAENLDRHNLDWRDEVKLLVKAAKMIRAEGFANGQRILSRDLGVILGVCYTDVQVAERIHDDLVANPQDYKDVATLRGSIQVLLKKQEDYLKSLQVENTMLRNPVQVASSPVENVLSDGAALLESLPSLVSHISLSSRFANANGIDWLRSRPAIDHIICDPDFAVAKDRLAVRSWSPDTSSIGVAQADVETSLRDMEDFFCVAFDALPAHGFLIFFMDLDHWEKFLAATTAVGFSTQRWPFIWHKLDARANSAPGHNFCKNMEYAMICRKPGAVLTGPQMSSIFACGGDSATKDFGHPFAKPRALWQKLFRAVAQPGQTIADPFAGSCSSIVAGLEADFNMVGREVQTVHYNTGLLNLQRHFRKELGEQTTFE